MSKFTYKRYPSIENSYQDKCIEFIETLGLANENVMWNVAEKLHGCLSFDTLITTREYGDIPISVITENKLNCHVLSYNIQSNETEWDLIVNHQDIENEHKQWYEIELDDGEILHITGNHLVWIPTEQKWVAVEDLDLEVFLLNHDIENVTIKKITKIKLESNLYDLETKNNHNCFANDVLVHNCNIGAYSDGIDVQWASRSAFVNDSFYGLFNGLSEKLKPNLNQLANLVKSTFEDVEYIIAYGELFGGAYPHKDVEKLNVSKVQDRIWYSPDVEYAGFDIFCVTKNSNDSFFINDDLKVELFKESDIFQSLPIFTGTLEDCLKQNNSFNSVIPNQLGYPELDENICEGLVIKPVNSVNFHSGSRVILKSKNLKFTEKAARVKKDRKPMTPEQLEAVEISECYITDNRLDNVLSKNDSVITQQLIGKFIRLLVKDAIEDLNKESDCLMNLPKSERKVITKNLQDLAKKLVLARVEYVI